VSSNNAVVGRPVSTSPGALLGHSNRTRRLRRISTPYLLLAPAFVIYAVFTVYPIYRQFDISFFNWHIFPGASNPYLGLSNYTAIFHDPVVRTAAFNSFLFIVITVPAQMALGLFAAAMLTDRLPGSMVWRAAIYIPVVTSWVVVSWVFSYIFSSQGGVMNAVAGFFAGHSVAVAWTAQTWTANMVIWILSIWKGVGWSFIIFLAALDGIPRQLLESARIDGATEFHVWRTVVLPSIRAAITFVTVMLVIGGAQVFTQIYLITKGGPYDSTQSMMTYMYQQAFQNFSFGYAAALASLLAVILFSFSAAEIRILRSQDF
jgi:multiple sugar transport system permease protein